MGSPYAHMSTQRVLIPDPNGVRLSYVLFFVVARSAFGFPAPYHTLRVWYTNPFGLVYATLHKPFGFVYRTQRVRYHTFGCDTLRLIRTHVRTRTYNFDHFDCKIKQIERPKFFTYFLSRTVTLRFPAPDTLRVHTTKWCEKENDCK